MFARVAPQESRLRTAKVRAIRARRRTAVLLLLSGLLALTGVWHAAPARADATGDEQAFAIRMGQERTARGLPNYIPAADLQGVARRQAEAMAALGEPFHNPALGSQVTNWARVAENVGVGPDVEAIHQAFMASPGHRTNILSSELTEAGIGTFRSGGRLWMVAVFRRPVVAASPTTASRSVSPSSMPAPPRTTAPPTTVGPPTTTTVPPMPTAAAAVATDPPVQELRDQAAGPASRMAVAVAAPVLPDPVRSVPSAAWAAAVLLAAVVGLQTESLRRLGLVR